MEFKVGDKVRILNTKFGNKGRIGIIEAISGTVMIYLVRIPAGLGEDCQWSDASDLELVTDEETNTKFKVGDKVRITWSCLTNKDKEGVISEDDGSVIPYKVTLDDGEVEWKHGNHITKLEEKVMKFKVGDKVKVSNSWEGRSGEVGQVVYINVYNDFTHEVRFEDMFSEHFREEELELVQQKAGKQQFTKSDLKTGMGVVLRDGTKGHVLLDTVAGNVIRFINEGSNQWASVDEYDENMIDCDMGAMDIVEVYSSKYAYCYLTDRVFNQDCVFKREEPKPEPKPEPEPTKMTMKEINEHFGKAIEIVE